MRANRARHASLTWNLTKTTIAFAVFQVVAFIAAPWGLMQLHWAIGDTRLEFGALHPLGLVLFTVFGVGHLTSAMILSTVGRGTPLWFDAPRRLVMVGPYARVRNPMVITAFGQATAVSLYSGSLLLVAYPLVGLLAWALLVRRGEEKELIRYFGRPYEIYRRSVPVLLPRASVWQPVDDAPTRTLVVSDEGGLLKGRRRRST